MNVFKLAIIVSVSAILPMFYGCTKQTTLDLGSKEIIAPVPLGFTPLGTRAPKFRVFVEKIMPPGVLIEYYLTSHDLQDVIEGHSKSRERFLSISMSKQMYGRDFSEENFLGSAYFRRTEEGKRFNNDEALENERKKIAAEKQGLVPHLAIDGKWLGVFIDKHDMIGVASTSWTSANGGLSRILSLSLTVRVKNRVIQLGCGSVIGDDVEIQPFEKMCSQWANDIVRDNPESAN